MQTIRPTKRIEKFFNKLLHYCLKCLLFDIFDSFVLEVVKAPVVKKFIVNEKDVRF